MAHIRKDPILALNVISQIHQLSTDFLTNELELAGAAGLVPSHGHILGCLYFEDNLPMNRIAEKIGRRKSTLTVLANRLEQAGYIQRVASPEDSRSKLLALTDKGKGIRAAFMEIGDRLQDTVWQGFSAEEKAQTMEFLSRMERNFLSTTADECGQTAARVADPAKPSGIKV